MALFAMLALGLGLIASQSAAAPFAYVANVKSNNVSVIDTATNMVVATVAVSNAPFAGAVAVTPDGKHVYVVNSGSNTVSVIDAATNTVEPTVVTVGNAPSAVAVTPDGKHANVTNTLSKDVSVIDTATNTVEPTVIVVGNFPDAAAVSPDGKRVYVVNGDPCPCTVSVIDTTTNPNKVVATVPLPSTSPSGNVPGAVAVTPDGKHAYVASTGFHGTVYVIDTATNTVEPTVITVGNAPAGVAVTPDGKQAYVANQNDNTVSVIDTTSNTVVGTPIPVGGCPLGSPSPRMENTSMSRMQAQAPTMFR